MTSMLRVSETAVSNKEMTYIFTQGHVIKARVGSVRYHLSENKQNLGKIIN